MLMRTNPAQEFTVLLRSKKKGPFSEALQIVESAALEYNVFTTFYYLTKYNLISNKYGTLRLLGLNQMYA